MDQAVHVLENHLIFRHKHFEWFDLSDEKIKKMRELFSSGYIYPLVERDSDGRRIILVNHGRLDTNKFTTEDAFHLYFTVLFTLLQEEETQIAGVSTICCYDDVTIKYISMFSLTVIANVVKFLKNSCPCRVKAFYLVDLPTFAVFLINSMKALMTEKLKNRVILIKSMSDLTQFVDKSLLPKELGGGKFTEAEMMEKFLKIFEINFSQLWQTNEFEIDLDRLSNLDEHQQETVGSFRRLEID